MGIGAQMYVRTKYDVTDAQIRQWSWELGMSFGPDNFRFLRKSSGYSRDYRALERVHEMVEDSDDGVIKPEEGETFLQVNLMSSYYGPGYERGDLPMILMVKEWLVFRIPDSSVWYGGDSSGATLVPLDQDNCTILWRHFLQNGHLPYADSSNRLATGPRPVCDLCQVPMNQTGFGYRNIYSCLGCGYTESVRG